MKLDYPSEIETAWLMARGVSDTALLEPTFIRAAKVQFHGQPTFEFDSQGVRALLFYEEECDDWVAWQPRLEKLGTWRAVAWALGQEAASNPASYFIGGALRVHRSPLDWLCANRQGLVIIRPEFAHVYLRDADVSCPDSEMARQFQSWRRPPEPKGRIFIEVPGELAA